MKNVTVVAVLEVRSALSLLWYEKRDSCGCVRSKKCVVTACCGMKNVTVVAVLEVRSALSLLWYEKRDNCGCVRNKKCVVTAVM